MRIYDRAVVLAEYQAQLIVAMFYWLQKATSNFRAFLVRAEQ